MSAVVPAWLRSYERGWLRPDLIAALVIWRVVTPQAVAYAQIAGLPPEAGLMAAPVAMLAYALLGTSHQLIVSATTATSAVSAATVGPLADGDPVRFAALSAALALVVAVVLIAGGLLRFGAISDLVSKPVMTGFLYGYRVDPDRDLVAMGAANALVGLSSGFVQSGGASQTAAADGAGGRSQLAGLVAAGMILLTGAFLAPLFEDLPQATLAAIVIVAVAGFFDVAELRRFARVRRSAIVFAALALAGVLVLGMLQGLVIAALQSLIYVVARLSRPSVAALARDPSSGAWGRLDRHPDWLAPRDVLVVRGEGPLMYPNANAVKDRALALLAAASPGPRVVVLDLSQSTDLDLQTVDTLAELADALEREGIELRLADVRAPALEVLTRAGLAERVAIEPTLDAAVQA